MAGNPSTGYYMDRSSNCGYVKDLFIKFVSGASGAVATLFNFNEVASLTRTGAGAYTAQFTQSYNGGRNLTGNVAQAAGFGGAGSLRISRVYDANEAANGTVKFQVSNAAGTATDPTTGDVVEVCFQVATATGYP